MKFQVVGSGCHKCLELEKRVKESLVKLSLKAEVEHVYDISRMMDLGVVSTPALIMNGKVILSGMVPTVEYLTNLIKSKAK